jgi:L-fuconolactonase
VPIADAHCHASTVWYEPIETLLFEMDRNGVDHAILIQMMGQSNNAYQFECVKRYPGRFASVVIVDPDQPDAPAALERLAEQGASGVRFNASTRSPGDDPLAIWRKAAQLGLSVSCGGNAAAFASDDFARVITEFPQLRIVIEHLGSVNHPVSDLSAEEARRKVFGLARYPNTSIKIHGLGEFSRRALPVKEPFPFVEPIPDLLEEVYRAFGPTRMMWGSDFPPVSSREGYRNALRWPMERLANKGQAAIDEIFGGTALKTFPVR